MPGEVIEIKFGKDGSSNLDAIGFKGEACKAATAPFKKILGSASSETEKPEIHDSCATGQHQQELA